MVLNEVFRAITNLRKNALTPLTRVAMDENNPIFTTTFSRINALLESECTENMDNMLLSAVRMYYYLRKVIFY